MKETKMKKNSEMQLVSNELLLGILNQMYSIELLLADVYCGKANLRYSNEMLDKDKQILDQLRDLVEGIVKKELE